MNRSALVPCVAASLIRVKQGGVRCTWPPIGAWYPLVPTVRVATCLSVSSCGGCEHRLWFASLFHNRCVVMLATPCPLWTTFFSSE